MGFVLMFGLKIAKLERVKRMMELHSDHKRLGQNTEISFAGCNKKQKHFLRRRLWTNLLRQTRNKHKQETFKHVTHVHPLVLVTTEDKDGSEDLARCRLCRKYIGHNPLYKCEPCGFYLHKACAQLRLQQKLIHFYHAHPLRLCAQVSNAYSCNACLEIRRSCHYLCHQCDFRLDLGCALLPCKLKSQGQEHHYHFGHGHPLTVINVNDGGIDYEEINCVACQKPCVGETYVCHRNAKCKFSLHKSCFFLPQRIQHPHHPGLEHELTMTSASSLPKAKCSVCYHLCNGLFYRCESCSSFNLHIQCPVKISTVKYQAHHHNLIFIEKIGKKKNIKCRACGKYCRSSSSLFRCAKCDFNLHLECGPLPCTLFCKSQHWHPLRLTNSPVEEDGEHRLDTDLFYCDECEKERDPRLPVYYCSERCAYIVEIKCVIMEVMLSLTGEYGQVELRSSITRMAGKVIGRDCMHEEDEQDNDGHKKIFHTATCNEIISSFTRRDRDLYQSITEAARRWSSQNGVSESKDQQGNLLSHEAHTLMKLLNHGKDKSRDKEEVVVKYGDHFIASDFSSLLENLDNKYEAICHKSGLPWFLPLKVYFCFMLGWTINSMCSTRVVDVSQDLLSSWWESLKILHFAGFRIQFALERLSRIVLAYYGLQAKDVAYENVEKLDREITDLSQDIEKLETMLALKKARLNALKKRRERTASKEIVDPSLLAKCLREASALKWTIAGNGIFEK